MPRWAWAALLVGCAVLRAAADIVLENPRVRAVLGEDAAWRAVVDKATGQDYCVKGRRVALALARVEGRTREANRAAMAGDRLTIGFAGCDTTLTVAVAVAPDWIVFRLERVGGTRPSDVTLVRLGVTLTKRVGRRLNIGWDDDYAVCLMAVNLQTQGRAQRRKGYAELTAVTQDEPGPKLEGAAVALVAAPTREIRGIFRQLSVACGLPRNEDAKGVPSKDLPIARQSYWFLSFGEKDVEKVIACCKSMGFRQVMMGSGSWCRHVGHYTFRAEQCPDGIESLRRTVARLHDHGILVGMHCFASKISKTDAYVTPVPDRRFWVDMSATLAAPVGPADTAIRTSSDLSQWAGSPVCKKTRWEGGVVKHQEVILDDEIVRYKTIGPEGRWDTFLGCQRGAWGTKAAPHKAGTLCRHYGVDGGINGYIIDQETSLLPEAHERLAHVFNTCGFDMVYFDGGEDVDKRRFTYYTSNFQISAMQRFRPSTGSGRREPVERRKRPIIHMGTCFAHNLWHSFTRSSTVDTYLNTLHGRIISGAKVETWPTVKDHIDRSVRYMLSVRDDMITGELGWFGIWPKGRHTDGLQLDEIEYLMCKSLAYDAPISLQTSFRQMESHPLTPGILEIVKAYEELRLGGSIPDDTRRRLREPGKDFLLVRGLGRPRFVEVERVPLVAGADELRGFVGARDDGSVLSVWHSAGREGTLVLHTRGLDAPGAMVIELEGPAVPAGAVTPGMICLPIGPWRLTRAITRVKPETVRELLTKASFKPRPPARLWLQAEDAARFAGRMAKGSAAGVKEPEALGDVVLCTGAFSRLKPQPWYAEYRVNLPHKGRWTLWARVRYPSATDHSFGIVRPGEEVTLAYGQVLGNCGRNEGKWHWTGRGGGSTAVPPGQPVTFTLPKGEFVFRIYAREGGGTPATNPRLDCLCLADDPAYVPTDADARLGLAKRD